MQATDVSAVVCTLNSMSGIAACLASLRESGVGELIVVDAGSADGTREIARGIADFVLDDPGTGLGNARNVGIARSTRPLILNMGSDNVMPRDQLQIMIDTLLEGGYQGVSARTVIAGSDFISQGLNAWRKGRFVPGPVSVIGTPTLFDGDLLRRHPYDRTRVFSDDSELCERWTREFDARFAISMAYVEEIGKTSWQEVKIRCRMYGISDEEVFRLGRRGGWTFDRQLKSLVHPLRVDFAQPLSRLPLKEGVQNAPFLGAFAAMRYAHWFKAAARGIKAPKPPASP